MPQQIYCGVWVDRSYNAAAGATITLRTSDGAFLLAFLAIAVSIAGGQFWTFFAFLLHQYRCSSYAVKPSDQQADAMRMQQQVVLRNVEHPFTAAWELFSISRAWRPHTKRSLRQSASLMLTAAMVAAAFAVAGIFTSQVSRAATKSSLLVPNSCGTRTDRPTTDQFPDEFARVANNSAIAVNYAENCYDTLELASDCDLFQVSSIKSTKTANASCPFAAGLCATDSALQLDTGYLDSNDVIGINSALKDRILFRQVSTCAPLNINGYTSLWYWKNITGLLYGSQNVLHPTDNFTYIDYNAPNIVRGGFVSSAQGYSLR
jgi:hypothetical protein